MVKVKLRTMSLENFKGINKLRVDFKSSDVDVFGDNEAGKTTLFDAFLWCLNGKDSRNKKDFQVKTLVNGEELHNLEHSVTMVLEVDGVKRTLKRIFKEIYRKGKGGAEQTFNGHKTFYEFDGVPCSEKEYKQKVDSIVSEEVMKLVTNPIYFNEMKWQDQRKLLFELVNDVTIDPLEKNKDLASLKPLLDNNTPEEVKAIYMAKMRKIKEQIDTIPARIDELNNMNNNAVEGADEAEEEVRKIELQVDDLRGQIARIKSGASIVELTAKINEGKSRLAEIENGSKKSTLDELNVINTQIEEVIGNGQIFKSKKHTLELELEVLNSKKERFLKELDEFREQQDSKRKEYYEVRDSELQLDNNCECPTCGQNLPKDVLESSKENALAKFEEDKKQKLYDIQVFGINLGEVIKDIEEKLSQNDVTVNEISAEVDSLNNKLLSLKDKHEKLLDKKSNVNKQLETLLESEEATNFKRKIKELTAQLAELKTNALEMEQDLDNEISVLLKKRNEFNGIIGQKAAIKANQARIEELQSHLQEYIKEFDNVDRVLYLLGEYNRTKVESLSESINNLFEITEFKLFNKLVNGDYEETCIATHKGVPYGKGLNLAASINVGLDIINVLSKHFNVSAPIFIDNAESVTKFIDNEGQRVRLYVKEGQKTLEFKEV